MTFWTKVRKGPENGVFLALKVPGDMNQSFAGVGGTNCMFITIVSAFWQSFKKSNGWIKSHKAKSLVLEDLGLLGAFLTPLGPWGRAEVFPQKFFTGYNYI